MALLMSTDRPVAAWLLPMSRCQIGAKPSATTTLMLLCSNVTWIISHNTYIAWQSLKFIVAEWRIYASVSKTTTGSDNGLSPVRRQAITWTNTVIWTPRDKLRWCDVSTKCKHFHLKDTFERCLQNGGHQVCLGRNVSNKLCGDNKRRRERTYRFFLLLVGSFSCYWFVCSRW